jgi:ABC-type multidrug transport system fused ATPase/permease subunit
MSDTTASQPGVDHEWDTIDQAVRAQLSLLLTAGTKLINSSRLVGRLDPISLLPAVLRTSVAAASRPDRMASVVTLAAADMLRATAAATVRAVGGTSAYQPKHAKDKRFADPGAESPVLRDINFTAAPGQTTAIIGSTGAGKSTLISLIPRLFDATGGSVKVDGVEVRECDPELLWSRIGLVPQKALLFSGTVGSNLRYGNPDATDEELWRALRVAQAEEFVREMPGQLEASISQGGTNVSGGQRQRLSIARALIKRPEIYVFDDSFSALDVATDARLRAALNRETADAAVIIVGQRVATIADADKIIVLEHGEIVGSGTHDQLLASCPTYAEIVDSQLSAEEAAA